MSHHPFDVRRTILVVVGTTSLAAGIAPPASAETLLAGPDAPLIVQGQACVGGACQSGTAPSKDFVVRNQDTPVVRLDQASGGFTPYVWDVAGNESNFFVRDVTAGDRLPFRIFPGASTNSLTVRDNRVGIGTAQPAVGLEVTGADGRAGLKVTESGSVEARTLADLTNSGPVAVRLADSDANVGWTMATGADGTIALTPEGSGLWSSLVLSKSGDVTAGGTVQQTADPARQTGVQAADEAAIVEAIKTLPIERFGLSGDASGAEHLAPSGAAFRSAFGLGSSDALVAPGDIGSVALVGVKALLEGGAGAADPQTGELVKRVDAHDARIDAHGARIDSHEARIAAAEQVAHGHERRMRKLEQQATLAERRFERTNRVQRRLRGEVSSLRSENTRLKRRLAAIEAAVAKLR